MEEVECSPINKVWIYEKRPYTAKEEANALLEEFDDIATEMNITHFLIHGTCVGFLSAGRYPITDPDIDVGILCSREKRRQLFQRLKTNGFIRNKIMQDIKWNCTFIKNNLRFDVYYGNLPMEFLQEFDKFEYNERVYNIPHPIEKYLESAYGNDWRHEIYPGLLIPDEIVEDNEVYEITEGLIFSGEHDKGRPLYRWTPPLFILIVNKQRMAKLVPFGAEEVKKIGEASG